MTFRQPTAHAATLSVGNGSAFAMVDSRDGVGDTAIVTVSYSGAVEGAWEGRWAIPARSINPKLRDSIVAEAVARIPDSYTRRYPKRKIRAEYRAAVELPGVLPPVSAVSLGADGTVIINFNHWTYGEGIAGLVRSSGRMEHARIGDGRVEEVFGSTVWVVRRDEFGVESVVLGDLVAVRRDHARN